MDLHFPHDPTDDVLEQFQRDGHLTLRRFLDPLELEILEPGLSAAVHREDPNAGVPWEERSTYDRAFIQVGDVHQCSDEARSLVFSRRLASAAAALLRVPTIRLYHDQALYKRPTRGDGGHTPWHVDQYYWPMATDRCITAWIPLVEVSDDMGPLTFASGSHRMVEGRELEISDESEARCDRALAEGGYTRSREPFELGDVSFHLGWTYHSAPPNLGTEERKVMTVIYMDGAMRVAEPSNDHQRDDLRKWLPGLAAGDLAASDANPLLWPAT